MCRFLLVKSKSTIHIAYLLQSFYTACKNSKEFQGDGWGISWLNKVGEWELQKFATPIWDSTQIFNEVPDSNLYAVHARSATYDSQKNIIEYNQPYVTKELVFVSNVAIKGMKLSTPVPGDIGAQKIFNLLTNNLSENALQETNNFILSNATHVRGCNIGLVNKDNIVGSCLFGEDPDYFSLHSYVDTDISLICSEKIGAYHWNTLNNGEIIKL